MKEVVDVVFSFIATLFIYILGGFDVALISLLTVIVIDYITGILKASKKRNLSSKIGYEGIKKKIGILCLVALSVVVDRITGESGVIRTVIIYYFVANEGLSIIENLAEIGVYIPEVLKSRLEQLKNSEGEK